ncbi:MAG: hypothetical protein M1314_03865, partial [Firmicutes bacterium]|nr:hypothetical protein [Bacillota bacterium]
RRSASARRAHLRPLHHAGSRALLVEGTLQKKGGCVDLLARRFWPLALGAALEGLRSHDFH